MGGGFPAGQSVSLQVLLSDGRPAFDVAIGILEEKPVTVRVPTLLNAELKGPGTSPKMSGRGLSIRMGSRSGMSTSTSGSGTRAAGLRKTVQGRFRVPKRFDKGEKVEVLFRKPAFEPAAFLRQPAGTKEVELWS